MVLEYSFQGLPKYVCNVMLLLAKSLAARTLQFCIDVPVFWFGSVRPCAVIVLNWYDNAKRGYMLQSWNTTAALPKMKSTVPYMSHWV